MASFPSTSMLIFLSLRSRPKLRGPGRREGRLSYQTALSDDALGQLMCACMSGEGVHVLDFECTWTSIREFCGD